MSSWNSVPLEIVSQGLGWVAFFSWSFSFYPQIILNHTRKSVVGLNFDFPVLNLTKHSSYGIYNAVLFFSSAVQRQYREKYGFDQMIPVAANDVAFSVHLVLLTLIILFQISIYERGNQKVSKVSLAITFAVWVSASVCFFMAWQSKSWLWLISVFNSIQVFMTFIKYIPQAYLNFERKSTVGWSIGFILLDLLGGVTSFGQMAMQSIDQSSWVNFYGNIGKPLLCSVSIFFDLIFIVQHYVLYPTKKEKIPHANSEEIESKSPLVMASYPSEADANSEEIESKSLLVMASYPLEADANSEEVESKSPLVMASYPSEADANSEEIECKSLLVMASYPSEAENI